MTTVGLIAIGRSTFDMELASAYTRKAHQHLAGLVEVVGADDVMTSDDQLEERLVQLDDLQLEGQHLDGLVILQATFTDGSFARRIADRFDLPLVFWSFPEERCGDRLRLNSLCGLNLAAHSLGRMNRAMGAIHHGPEALTAEQFSIALGDADHSELSRLHPVSAEHLSAQSKALAERAAARLASMRTGVIGDHPHGFEPCRYDPGTVRQLTGIGVDRLELSDLFEAADAVTSTELAAHRARASDALGSLGSDSVGVDQSMRLYGGLSSLVERYDWAGVAVRCWPECMTEYGGAACAPQAMLTDDGVPGMCEADVLGNLTSLILNEFSDDPPFIADLVDLDPNDDTGVFWHCGLAPLALANTERSVSATVHSNRHLPLLHDFALKPGTVTIARLSQARDQLQLVVGLAEMLDRPQAFSGTSGVAAFDCPATDLLDQIVSGGIEHHYGIAYGDLVEPLLALAAQWQIPVNTLG